MTGMTAIVNKEKGVLLTWQVESEVNCYGFNIWRSESDKNDFVKVNTIVIQGRGNSSDAFEYTFTDRSTKNGITYWYKIEEISTDNQSTFYGPISVEAVSVLPDDFHFSPNFPNPFNPTTTFKYQLPRTCHVDVRVFDLLGKEISVLVDQEVEAGYHSVVWNGTNSYGVMAASGVYLITFKADEFAMVRKMSLMR